MRLKYIIVLSLSLLMMVSCTKEDQRPHFSIDSALTGLTANQAQLVSFTPPVMVIDTVTVEEGTFHYEGESEVTQALTIYLEDNSVWITVWIKNGDQVKITGDIDYPELVLIEGGETNNLLSSFKTDNKELIKKRIDLEEQLKQAKEAGLSKDSIEGIYSEMTKATYSLKNKAVAFLDENPQSIASLVLLQDYVLEMESPEKLGEYMNRISGEAKEDPLYMILNNAIVRLSDTYIGVKAPDFKLIDEKSDTLRLSTFKENYLLLNFSVAEQDSTRNFFDGLVDLYEESSKLPLNVLTISLESKHLDWTTLPKGAKKKWFDVVESEGWNSSIVARYNVTEVTDNYLLDKDRSIIAHNISPDSIRAIVQKK